MAQRGSDGRYLPGVSGNPGGRPAMPAGLRGAAQAGADEAVARLRSIVADRAAPAAAVVLACREILDRAYGRPVPEDLSGRLVVDQPAPVTRFQMFDRLWRVWCDRGEPLGETALGAVAEYRLPSGEVVSGDEFDRRGNLWIDPILDGLFGPDDDAAPAIGAPALPAERHPDDHWDLGLPDAPGDPPS